MTEERDTWTMGWPFPGLEVPYEEPPLTRWEKVAYAVTIPVALALPVLLAYLTGAF
jgi:hypothetical protein